ncbi:MAG: ATP-binding cassette domain-containing protein [Chloroflexota bacterium]|nr:ATP-binding cassette domain-containing protein [Chloroflexota bacterium]
MIEVENLTKYYGNFIAIEDVSFKVAKGEVVGFLGPNAAGKTTTMRILTGFMPPTRGTARIAGYDLLDNSLEVRRRIGYLPETVPLYTDMTVRAYLDFQGTLRRMSQKRRQARIKEVINLARLGEYRDTLIGKLSKGFRQRVGIAQAILHEPEVLILDEPTIGIDPRQVVETRQLIKNLGKEHTIILSSHVLPEVSQICHRVVIINEGRIVAVDSTENLSRRLRGSQRIELVVRGPEQAVVSKLKLLKGVWQVAREGREEPARYVVECTMERDLREDLAALVVQSGWGLQQLTPLGMTLEDVFLKLTTKEEV